MVGPMEDQVERLIAAQLMEDSQYIHTFFNTYQKLGDTQQVVDLLFKRFRTQDAPAGCSGQTDALQLQSQDVIPHDLLCYVVSSLLNTWLQCRPDDFLEGTQHACLQRLLAHVRLHLCGSELESRVSQLLAQLGIQETSQCQAKAPAAAQVVDGTASGQLDVAPCVTRAPSTVGAAESGGQAEAVSGLNAACRPLGGKGCCVDQESPATREQPSPEGAREASLGGPSSPTLGSEASCTKAPGPSAEQEATGSGELEPGGSLPPMLGPHAAPGAKDDEEAASSMAPFLHLGSVFSEELELLLPVALLLFFLGAPAGLLCLLGLLALGLCAMRAWASWVPWKPDSTMAIVHGPDGAPAGSGDTEPQASGAPFLTCSLSPPSSELVVFVTLVLFLLVCAGPSALLSMIGILILLLGAVRALNFSSKTEPWDTSLPVVRSAQGATEGSGDMEAGLSLPPPIKDPSSGTELEVFLTLCLLFYHLGAPGVALFVLGVPTLMFAVIRATAWGAEGEPSAMVAQVPRANEAPASRPASQPSSSLAAVGPCIELGSRAELDFLLSMAAVLSLIHTPALALCVGIPLLLLLPRVAPPPSETPWCSAETEPGSSMALERRPGLTAASWAERESSCREKPVSCLQSAPAGHADMEATGFSIVRLQAEETPVSIAVSELHATVAPLLTGVDTVSSRAELEPHASTALVPWQGSTPAWSPLREPHSVLSMALDQAPAAAVQLDLHCPAVPAQEARHATVQSRHTVYSYKMPRALSMLPHRMSEQLTCIDMALFEVAMPHHCVGSIWSQRQKKGMEHLAPSIRAIVTQFNQVVACVISTCLGDRSMNPADRAFVLEFWIQVAEGCRLMRNFSSLHAIMSALRSTAILRLHRTWRWVSRECLLTFNKLADITSVENNYFKSRQLLLKEMRKLAKKEKRLKEGRRWFHRKVVITGGIVPYLGIFLKDLNMIHTAYQHLQDEDMRRIQYMKEKEMIEQLKQLQRSCRYYIMRSEDRFLEWIRGVEQLSEDASYKLSCAVEPCSQTYSGSLARQKLADVGKAGEIAQSTSQEQVQCGPANSNNNNSGHATEGPTDCSTPCAGLSPSHLDFHRTPKGESSRDQEKVRVCHVESSTRTCGRNLTGSGPTAPAVSCTQEASTGHFPKCGLGVGSSCSPKPLYRKQLTKEEKTSDVILKAMNRYSMSMSGSKPEDLELVQVISEAQTLRIPEDSNMFDVMNTSAKFDCVVEERTSSYRSQIQSGSSFRLLPVRE